MTIDFASLPILDEAPKKQSRKSTVRREIVARHFSRRTMFKALFVGATAVSLTTLDMVSRATGAYAATNWGDCPNWINRPDVTPDWTNCNPDGSSAGRIGSGYCGSDNFHRIGSISDGGGYYTQYQQRDYSCTGKNAWAWRPNGVGPFPEPWAKRCSDGRVRYGSPSGVSSWVNSTCRYAL